MRVTLFVPPGPESTKLPPPLTTGLTTGLTVCWGWLGRTGALLAGTPVGL